MALPATKNISYDTLIPSFGLYNCLCFTLITSYFTTTNKSDPARWFFRRKFHGKPCIV